MSYLPIYIRYIENITISSIDNSVLTCIQSVYNLCILYCGTFSYQKNFSHKMKLEISSWFQLQWQDTWILISYMNPNVTYKWIDPYLVEEFISCNRQHKQCLGLLRDMVTSGWYFMQNWSRATNFCQKFNFIFMLLNYVICTKITLISINKKF